MYKVIDLASAAGVALLLPTEEWMDEWGSGGGLSLSPHWSMIIGLLPLIIRLVDASEGSNKCHRN